MEHVPKYVSELCPWDRATIAWRHSTNPPLRGTSDAVGSVRIQEGHMWSRVQKPLRVRASISGKRSHFVRHILCLKVLC